MSPENHTKSETENEFIRLEQNIKESLEALWNSDDKKRFQNEIERGIVELTNTVSNYMDNVSSSSAAQKVKTEIDEFKNEASINEIHTRIRQEIIGALKHANDEIEKANQRLKKGHGINSQNIYEDDDSREI